MMKRFMVIGLVALVAAGAVFADVLPYDTVEVARRVWIVNVSAVPELAVLAYVVGPDLPGNKPFAVYEIKNNRPLDAYSVYNTLSVIAVSRTTLSGKRLADIDFQALIASGQIVVEPILQPFAQMNFSDRRKTLVTEKIGYRISAVAGSRLFLTVDSVEQSYSNGDKAERLDLSGGEPVRFAAVAKASVIAASSRLKDAVFEQRYDSVQAFDGDPFTAWVEGRTGSGIGEFIKLTLETPTAVDAVAIMGGAFRSDTYRSHNRIKTLLLEVNDADSYTVELDDAMIAGKIDLKPGTMARTLRFVVQAVYKAEKWDYTPIAEIRLLSGSQPLKVDCSNSMEFESGLQSTYDELRGH